MINAAYQLAKTEIGTVEWADGSNPKVVAYFKDAGHHEVSDDATAWCAAFVGAMLARAGMKGTGKLNARSYLDWGVPVDRAAAREGDIVIFKRGNSSWQGHVGFFVRDNGSTITVLGGNQSNAVSRQAYPSANLLGIRRAAVPVRDHAPPPATAQAGTPPASGWLATIIAALAAVFGRKAK